MIYFFEPTGLAHSQWIDTRVIGDIICFIQKTKRSVKSLTWHKLTTINTSESLNSDDINEWRIRNKIKIPFSKENEILFRLTFL